MVGKLIIEPSRAARCLVMTHQLAEQSDRRVSRNYQPYGGTAQRPFDFDPEVMGIARITPLINPTL